MQLWACRVARAWGRGPPPIIPSPHLPAAITGTPTYGGAPQGLLAIAGGAGQASFGHPPRAALTTATGQALQALLSGEAPQSHRAPAGCRQGWHGDSGPAHSRTCPPLCRLPHPNLWRWVPWSHLSGMMPSDPTTAGRGPWPGGWPGAEASCIWPGAPTTSPPHGRWEEGLAVGVSGLVSVWGALAMSALLSAVGPGLQLGSLRGSWAAGTSVPFLSALAVKIRFHRLGG